jgi:hypothetical protein
MPKIIQELVDEVFQVWGRAAPVRRADENERKYIERISRIARDKNYLAFDEPTRKIDFRQLPDGTAFNQFTTMLLDGIKRSVARPDTVNPEERERKMIMRDQSNREITGFVRAGNRPFTDDFHQPCRRARIVRPATMTLLGGGAQGMSGIF